VRTFNNAIATMHKKTEDIAHREMGEAIFSGSLYGAWLANSKQFIQLPF